MSHCELYFLFSWTKVRHSSEITNKSQEKIYLFYHKMAEICIIGINTKLLWGDSLGLLRHMMRISWSKMPFPNNSSWAKRLVFSCFNFKLE